MITQSPETPIVEELEWSTDVQVADDGSEVRICLRDEPKRTLQYKYVFSEEDEIRAVRYEVFASTDRPFVLPFWHHASKLLQPLAIGGQNVAVALDRTELRAGCDAILFDRRGRVEAVTVAGVLAAGVTLNAPVASRWPAGAMIAPAWPMLAGNGITISRFPLAGGTMTLNARDANFMVPFLNPKNVAQFVTFSGLPVIPYNAIGSNFDESYQNGSSVTDFGGVPFMRVPWNRQAITFGRTFLCNRVFNRSAWQWWNKFFDYMKGSFKAALLPTWREDFEVAIRPVAGGNTMQFEGAEYAEAFFPFEAFRFFAIRSRTGLHYAKASNCVVNAGRSIVTFAPPLPAGQWADEQLVSLMIKVRIADDKVSCEHSALQTRVSLNLRTVDS